MRPFLAWLVLLVALLTPGWASASSSVSATTTWQIVGEVPELAVGTAGLRLRSRAEPVIAANLADHDATVAEHRVGHGAECIWLDDAHATKGARQAPKLLNAVPKSVLNTSNHIFGPKSLGKHKLGPVLEAFGGDKIAATYGLQNAAQTLANTGAIRGVFDTTVRVAGQNVTVRGAVINGVANLRTAFIP